MSGKSSSGFDAHRQSVRRRWNIVMAGASYDEAVVREHFPRLALEHDLIARIEELEAQTKKLMIAAGAAAGETQLSISNWANATFGPASSNARVAARANEEMAELLRALTADDNHPNAGNEIADIVIVLSRLATRLNIDIADAVNAKMAINRTREWKLTADGHGYHVRDKAGK